MAPYRTRSAVLGAALVMGFAAPALAQGAAQPKPVAQFGDWSVYTGQTGTSKVCYALSQPKDRKPEGLNRDPAYFFVSTRPGEKVKNEVSITMGFGLKEGSEAKLTIGSQVFQLYTKDEGAWVRNVAEEGKLVEAMKKGKDLTIAGTSGRGNVTTDRYSMSGLGQALDRVAQECK
ncbi:MAG: invasion associated locus B family protein [Pseudomonadota bacterium]|jgi:invasion protein IalB